MAIVYVDETKIQQQLVTLNSGLTSPQWVAVQGENAFTGFGFDQNGKAIFYGSSGYPVKLFFNTVTKELKMYSLTLFLSNRQE